MGFTLRAILGFNKKQHELMRRRKCVNVTYSWVTAGRKVFLAAAVALAVDVEHERRTRTITGRAEQSRLSADAVSVGPVTAT